MSVSVLVVEDEPGFLKRFCDAIAAEPVLRLCGAATTVAGACTLVDTLVPDVVLVDLGLPGISGYEVARRLRKHPQLQDVCIVAQTGWGDTNDRRRTKEAGFDHHLFHPLAPEELRAVSARKRA